MKSMKDMKKAVATSPFGRRPNLFMAFMVNDLLFTARTVESVSAYDDSGFNMLRVFQVLATFVNICF